MQHVCLKTIITVSCSAKRTEKTKLYIISHRREIIHSGGIFIAKYRDLTINFLRSIIIRVAFVLIFCSFFVHI